MVAIPLRSLEVVIEHVLSSKGGQGEHILCFDSSQINECDDWKIINLRDIISYGEFLGGQAARIWFLKIRMKKFKPV